MKKSYSEALELAGVVFSFMLGVFLFLILWVLP